MKNTPLINKIRLLIDEQSREERYSENQAIRDILTDIRHICNERGIDFTDVSFRAGSVYEDEYEILNS